MSAYETELYRILGEMIREARTGQGITLEQVADRLSLTPKTIQRYECGERKIKISTIMEITSMLHIDYDTFMAGAKAKLVGETPNVATIAAHHEGEEWTAEELDEIESFKQYILSKRKNKE